MPKKPETIAKGLLKDAPDPAKLAQAITDIARAMQTLEKSGLSRTAVAVLIKHQTNVTLRDINLVLDCATQLDKIFLKK